LEFFCICFRWRRCAARWSRVPISRFIAVLLIYFVAVTGGITKWHTVVNSAGGAT